MHDAFGSQGEAYPAITDGLMHLHSPILIIEGTGAAAVKRGEFPGLMQPLQDKPGTPGQILNNGADLLLITGAITVSAVEGRYAFKISGSWR